jgi:hypothetical protein
MYDHECDYITNFLKKFLHVIYGYYKFVTFVN